MLRTIILHIGMYHTGTTAMQDVLSANPPELVQHGIRFWMSMPLTYALHGEVSPALPKQSKLPGDVQFAAAVENARKANAHTLVLSHEGITYNPYYRSLTNYLNESLDVCRRNADHVMHRLRALTKDFEVRIVFCPRRQDHWINSNFCNAVHLNGMCAVSHASIEERAHDCLSYYTLMERWASVFGRENIVIRPYEKAQMPKGTLHDFCENVLGCPVPDGAAYTTNVTPGSDVIRLCQRLNPYFDNETVKSLYVGMDGGAKASALLSYVDRLNILRRFKDENDQLARQYLHRDDLFFEATPEPTCFPAKAIDIATERRPRLAAQILAKLTKASCHVDEGVVFKALDLAQPSSPCIASEDIFLLPEGETGQSHDVLVRMPRENMPERQYILQQILCQWLGLRVRVVAGDGPGYHICTLQGESRLHLADTLFEGIEDGQWRTVQRLPMGVSMLHHEGQDIPIFYGEPVLRRDGAALVCEADIFGMCFFMLSRFEETLVEERDKFKRVPAQAQFVVRHGLEQVPLVDLWAGWLEKILREVGIETRRRAGFALHLTHDLDLFGDDDNLQWLAKTNKSTGHAGILNIMGVPTHALDGDFVLAARGRRLPIIDTLVREYGFGLGFHPGIDAWLNRLVWRAQYESLLPVMEMTGSPLTQGRQHYLRYAVPFTWRLWEENGMTLDTGMGYAERLGFRCGTGHDFAVFDVLARRTLRLKERPLIVMDASKDYLDVPLDVFFESICNVVKQAQRYKTACTVLFHNSFFMQSCDEWIQRRKYYARFLASFHNMTESS